MSEKLPFETVYDVDFNLYNIKNTKNYYYYFRYNKSPYRGSTKTDDKKQSKIFVNDLIHDLIHGIVSNGRNGKKRIGKGTNFSKMYDQFIESGVDEVYCTSVNDTFVMNAWFEQQGIEKVKPLPDGNGELARQLGLLVKKE